MELCAEKLTRIYFRQGKGTNVFTAVQPLDLTLREGELTCITGRSGSGKSTLLHLLAGLLQPSGGRVLLDETDLYALPDAQRARLRNRDLGIVPQGQTALGALTVLENILLPAELYPSDATEDVEALVQRGRRLLQEVGIGHLENVFPDELSGGERRRLGIARALIMDPKMILADEPTSDLDDESTMTVLRILRQLADNGKGVFLVTHEREAKNFADRVFRMEQGNLLALQK